MKNPIENIRLSQQAKDRLITLKRTMGMTQWNELCRWAFCLSLSDPNTPTDRKIPSDSSVEMTWKTFGGPQHELYWALLRLRCQQDGLPLEDEVLKTQFRLHLHRGIAAMAGNPRLRTIESVIKLVTKAKPKARS
jgi:DNA sulfur modification protein DndE